MNAAASLTTDILAVGTVLSLLLAAALVLLVYLKHPFLQMLRAYALPIAFIATLAASILSLVYSDIWGIAPCGLCWLQRAMLYPLPLLLGIALFAKDSGVWKYVLGLSVVGGVIALYQHLLQMGAVGALPCPASPGAADCAQRIVFEFGFVTFPLMAVGVFALTAALMLLVRKR